MHVFVLIITNLVFTPRGPHVANQCRTQYHTRSTAHSEIKQHVRGDAADVTGKQNMKSTVRFIQLCGLNVFICSSKLSWPASNRTPNLLHNSNVPTPTPTVLTLVTLDAANLNSDVTAVGGKSAWDRYVARSLITGDSGSIPVGPCAIYGGPTVKGHFSFPLSWLFHWYYVIYSR
jgi:hypothetical protein